jgi:photosystem II stability/assembly factor-like uncharacterized protein
MRYDTSKGSWVAVNQVIEKSVPAPARRTATVKKISTPNSKAAANSPAPTVTKSTVPFHAKMNDMAFSRDAWYAATEDGLLISRDHGLNWSSVSLNPVVPAAATSGTNAFSVRAIRLGKGNSYLWALTPRQLEVSGDNGKTWISHALPIEPRGALHFQPADESTVVLASDHGVFVSRDAGESWHQANLSELLINDLAPIRSAIVVSSVNGSLFLSRDAGKSWQALDSPSAENSVSAVRAQEAGNQLVVASATEGLFVMDMGSASSASADSAEPSLAPRR